MSATTPHRSHKPIRHPAHPGQRHRLCAPILSRSDDDTFRPRGEVTRAEPPHRQVPGRAAYHGDRYGGPSWLQLEQLQRAGMRLPERAYYQPPTQTSHPSAQQAHGGWASQGFTPGVPGAAPRGIIPAPVMEPEAYRGLVHPTEDPYAGQWYQNMPPAPNYYPAYGSGTYYSWYADPGQPVSYPHYHVAYPQYDVAYPQYDVGYPYYPYESYYPGAAANAYVPHIPDPSQEVQVAPAPSYGEYGYEGPYYPGTAANAYVPHLPGPSQEVQVAPPAPSHGGYGYEGLYAVSTLQEVALPQAAPPYGGYGYETPYTTFAGYPQAMIRMSSSPPLSNAGNEYGVIPEAARRTEVNVARPSPTRVKQEELAADARSPPRTERETATSRKSPTAASEAALAAGSETITAPLQRAANSVARPRMHSSSPRQVTTKQEPEEEVLPDARPEPPPQAPSRAANDTPTSFASHDTGTQSARARAPQEVPQGPRPLPASVLASWHGLTANETLMRYHEAFRTQWAMPSIHRDQLCAALGWSRAAVDEWYVRSCSCSLHVLSARCRKVLGIDVCCVVSPALKVPLAQDTGRQ